ncbi:MAG: SDR family oxidoreductase [Emcibacteraceae bacterium]|jgi:3-hydroxybutyrate dehydrogenase|tara:strand:+ start:17118 stop:17867 length:750 start_codon:yes stop_codon:yes gene_type:complete
MSLVNNHAVVTGGATGIGLAITRALVDAGAIVTIMGRDKKRLDNIANESNKIKAIQVDITDVDSVNKAFVKASLTAPITILINNAGKAFSAPFHKTSFDEWEKIIAVNLTGIYLTISAVLTEVNQAKHGRIINIASISGLEGAAYTSAYSASKHGVIGLMKSLACELSKVNTTINSICPAFVNTDIVEKAIINIMNITGRSRETALQSILDTTGQSKLIEPEEVALKVIKLCAPEADTINGTSIVMDGK